MKKKFQRVREYWKNMMHSTHHAMSRGSEYISRMIAVPHGESWRRSKKNHRSAHHHK
jgi:hypothetical protein